MTRHFILLSLLLFTVVGNVSRAAEEKPPTAKKEIPDRQKPDYDGRGGEPTTVGDALLWVPRVAFFPFYVATEYLYRRPLVWLGRTVELNNVRVAVVSFLSFGEEERFIVYPSLLVDFGFRPSFGLNFRGKNFPFAGHTLRVRGATGGTDYGILQISDAIRLTKTTNLRLAGEIGKRPDFIFHSMGPMSSKDTRYRYGVYRKEASVGYVDTSLPGNGSGDFAVAVRDVEFYNGGCCNDPGIDQGIAGGIFPTPSRYPGGYTSAAQRLHLNWGGRVSRPADRVGAIFDGTADHSFDLKGGGWWVYGGAVTGYLDITGSARVASLRIEGLSSDGVDGKAVPFNELPSIGGNRLPGFLSRRFIGQSAFAATFEYRWPVLSLVDGVFHFGVGNVFGQGFNGLATQWLRKSIGFGIEAAGLPGAAAGAGTSPPFSFEIAFGSQPFAFGGAFNEFRLALLVGGT